MKSIIYRTIRLSLLLYGFFALAAPNEATPNDGKGSTENLYIIPRITSEIRIDGKLEKPAWQEALVIELPYETWPGENITAPVRTEALLVYTKSYLYVGFRAFDPDPEKIRANFTERDQIYDDDFIALFLDTFNDERRAFALRSNPLGVQADDIKVTSLEESSVSWDAIYESERLLTDSGYAAKWRFPLGREIKQLTQFIFKLSSFTIILN